MRKIIYIISLCMAVGLAACGTSGKQAKTKSQHAEFVKDPLTPEQRRKYDYKKENTMRLMNFISTALIFIRLRGLLCMK